MKPAELFDLTGRVAIVTGALGLLGREHCRTLAAAGAHVVVADLQEELCRDFAQELGNGSIGVGMDVTQPDELRRACQRILQHFGRIDVLVNNAALNDMVEDPLAAPELSRVESYPLDLWRRVLEVNVTGVFLCCQVFGSVMAQQRSGSIINIASTYGLVAPDQRLYRRPDGQQTFYKSPVYPTSKGAVLALTRFLAAYWGECGVRVNAITPGGVENKQEPWFVQAYAERTPLRRMAQPTDLRGALLFLASDASAYVTGANIVVDGGWTIW